MLQQTFYPNHNDVKWKWGLRYAILVREDSDKFYISYMLIIATINTDVMFYDCQIVLYHFMSMSFRDRNRNFYSQNNVCGMLMPDKAQGW